MRHIIITPSGQRINAVTGEVISKPRVASHLARLRKPQSKPVQYTYRNMRPMKRKKATTKAERVFELGTTVLLLAVLCWVWFYAVLNVALV